MPFITQFSYVEKLKQAYEITLMSVCVCLYVFLPLQTIEFMKQSL
jgi:hypothetical protein